MATSKSSSLPVSSKIQFCLRFSTCMISRFFSPARGHPDPNSWPSKTINPRHGTFSVDSNEETEVILNELLPNQQYFLRVSLNIQDGDGSRVSPFAIFFNIKYI